MAAARQWNEDGHAIVQATFAVDFASNPAAQTIREMLALHSKLEEDYPRRRETIGRMIGFEAGKFEAEEISPEITELKLAGFIFDSLRSNGQVVRSITLDENNKLSITRNDYESWDKTWGESREILGLMLPVMLHRSDLMAFHLQYHDRFVWEGESDAFRADMIFRRDNQYLVPNIFDAPELWHSYHGYFEYYDQPHKHQLLNVAEVQVIPAKKVGLEASPGIFAEVRMNHRIYHGVELAGGQAKPIKTVEEVFGPEDATGLLDTYMNEMHDQNKRLLTRLINDEMCDKIGLDRPE